MTSISIKKENRGVPESIFSGQGGLRGKMFENHCNRPKSGRRTKRTQYHYTARKEKRARNENLLLQRVFTNTEERVY
jgi:hypothetical protein